MNEVAIITLVSIVFFVALTWIASALLTFRDRYFPREPRPDGAGPWVPSQMGQRPLDLAAFSCGFDTRLFAGA